MIASRLILIEGLPGSGKTTTATGLAERMRRAGLEVACWLENDPANPLVLPERERGLAAIMAAFGSGNRLLPWWSRLAASLRGTAVVEARFWQDSLMFMHLAGRTAAEIAHAHDETVGALDALAPALVWLDQPADERLSASLAGKAALDPAWAAASAGAFLEQAWFSARPHLEGVRIAAFYDSWWPLARGLFERFPGAKLRVASPQSDWGRATAAIDAFVGLPAILR